MRTFNVSLFKIVSLAKQLRITSTEIFLGEYSDHKKTDPPQYVARYEGYRIVLFQSLEGNFGNALFFDETGKHARNEGIEGIPTECKYS